MNWFLYIPNYGTISFKLTKTFTNQHLRWSPLTMHSKTNNWLIIYKFLVDKAENSHHWTENLPSFTNVRILSALVNTSLFYDVVLCHGKKRVRKKSRECHNHKPQPFPDTKRKRKSTNPNKHKSNKRTKTTKISSLFPKRGNCNAKRTEKHKNKMTQGKT